VDPVGAAAGAIATVSRPLDVHGGQTLQLEYPRTMTDEVVQKTVIPAVEGVVRNVVSISTAIRRAVVTAYTENNLRITYMSNEAKVLRQDVIPILATVRVHQKARDQLDNMSLDADLYDAARAALDDKRRRRIGN
jgi:hypothetical protein